MSYARRALIVAWKDLVVERRSKETLNALLFFSLALLFVFQFTLGPDRERLAAVLPGVLWLGFILSGVLGLGRTFLVERENDCWEALLLAPGDKSAVYVGKLAASLRPDAGGGGDRARALHAVLQRGPGRRPCPAWRW